ncbi:MAG: septal ring lytic transglycosylase RlpA family protein [Pseudohongiellaceae bacterium]|nr:septal ring lytic transglycosylase RlpA family protein [Pseudohongiellaceae bacterium]
MLRRAPANALLAIGIALMVTACGTISRPSPSTAGMSASDIYQATRYDIDQDIGPSRALDLSQVKEVIPGPVNRTLAGNKNPYTVNGQTYYLTDNEAGYRERGLASWYGEKFHGHRTSNGEIYDMYQLSAAHKSLPLPGFARVTNLENQRSIVVRVNDRGPFHEGRVIDLSYAAAYMLGYADQGTALVEVEAIVPPTTAMKETARSSPSVTGEAQFLQVGAFGDQSSAEALVRRLNAITTRPVFIRTVVDQASRELHRVRIGPVHNSAELERIKAAVVAANLGSPYTVRD